MAKEIKRGKKQKMSNRTRILMRYSVISLGLVLLAICIVGRLVNTTVLHAEEWNNTADSLLSQLKVLPPERGNILADNGNILACNLTVYDINFDMRHQKVRELGKKLPWASIDSLADSLDVHYPLKAGLDALPDKDSPDSWHTKFQNEFGKEPGKRPRALKIMKKGTLEDFEKIKSFPFFNQFTGDGTRNPVYVDPKKDRIYPFGKMAYRSIGRVHEFEKEFHGYSGLERDLDSLLYGKEGYAKKVVMTNGVDNWIDTPPQRGYDVQTTINIDMQDIVEEELAKICMENEAIWGTALLIEVETGEIKAIANVELLDDGSYGEALNRAVRGFEPGSVMKPISMMIAFEDGLVKTVNDQIDCSPFQRTSDNHQPPVKTMKQVIEMSSNTGISRVMFREFADDPESYHERLRQIGFFDHFNSGIAGEEVPVFPTLAPRDKKGNKQTMTARHLTLARQCYGYSATIPPLYTLAYYNAIANDGILVKPHLVKRLIGETGDSLIDIAALSQRVCSKETAQKMQECLIEPVWGDHGTARSVRDERVKIAGKTGTAFPIPEKGGAYDETQRRFAFSGYFPADNPKYSCMALILTPYQPGRSAASTSGQVVKNIAVKLFSRGMLDNVSTFTAERSDSKPLLSRSASRPSSQVREQIGVASSTVFTDNYKDTKEGTVPNLTGYDIESSLKALEERGYNVTIDGAGYVFNQEPAPGARLDRGGTVHLTLQN